MGELLSSRVEAGLLPQQVKQAAVLLAVQDQMVKQQECQNGHLLHSELAPQRGYAEVLNPISSLNSFLMFHSVSIQIESSI